MSTTSGDLVPTARSGDLPASLTSFIGRDVELAAIADLLAAARLVTLYGPSGMGKTRLAEEAARRLRPDHRHGVALIDLTQLEQRDRLARFVAESLPRPLHDQSARPGREALLSSLTDLDEDERLLLVLDNCEEIVEDVAALCVDILRAAPAVRILATSRIPLQVPGERWLRVPPLSLPADGAGDGEALRLLVERAREQMPGFAVTETNRDDLVRLCRTLDGIPLALELAAPWLRMVSPVNLVHNLDLLGQNGSQVGRRESHRSLAAMVGATWQDCTPAQRALWTRLWVLVGQWDLDAARAVGACDEVPAHSVLEVLEQLEFRSVVVADLSGEAPRFWMRETFRQEGRRQAAMEEGLVEEVRRIHARHFGDGVRRTAALYYTADELDGMRWFGSHLPNIRAALSACCEVSGVESIGLEMATGLGGYLAWWFHGSLNEGKSWLERTGARNPTVSPLRVVALGQQGFFTTCQGDHDLARTLLVQAREMLGDCELGPETTYAEAVLAGIEGAHRWLSGHADGGDLLLRASDKMAELGQRGPRYFLLNLAVFAGATYSDDSAEMLRLARWLLSDTVDAGRPGWNRSWALATAGLTELRHGDPETAVGLLRSGLLQQLTAGDKWGPGLVGLQLAEAMAAVGQLETAARLLRAALVLVERSGMRLTAMVPLAEGVEQANRILRQTLGEDVLHSASGMSRADAEATLLAFVSSDESGRALSGEPTALTSGPEPLLTDAPKEPAGRALSERELTVAELVAEGLTYREIAERLFISIRTVESHIQNIMGKLEVRNRTEIGRWWHRRN